MLKKTSLAQEQRGNKFKVVVAKHSYSFSQSPAGAELVLLSASPASHPPTQPSGKVLSSHNTNKTCPANSAVLINWVQLHLNCFTAVVKSLQFERLFSLTAVILHLCNAPLYSHLINIRYPLI